MRLGMNQTTLIVVAMALAASVGIGAVLGQLSGDDGDAPEATRSALSAPAKTAEGAIDGPPAKASATPAPVATPATSSPVPVPAVASPLPSASPRATPIAE